MANGAKKTPLFHVIRKEYFGDKGSQVACNVTKERAEEYAKEMQAADRAAYEVVPSDGK